MITRKLKVDWGITGLAATNSMYYRVVDADNANLIARTNVGVSEYPVASGLYQIKVTTWDPTWVGEVVWDDDGGVNFASEAFDAFSGQAISVELGNV